jgi:hypothetical protein
MEKAEFLKLLGEKDLLTTLDVKTLILDLVKDLPQDELIRMFWEKLPELDESTLQEYLFMRRD